MILAHSSVEFPFSWHFSIIMVFVSSGHFLHGGMQVELGYWTVKNPQWLSRSFVFVLFRLLSMLRPRMDSWASCHFTERSLWLLLLSKGSNQAPNSWRTSYKVGLNVRAVKLCFLCVWGQPQPSYCYDITAVQGKCHSFIGSHVQDFIPNGSSLW